MSDFCFVSPGLVLGRFDCLLDLDIAVGYEVQLQLNRAVNKQSL